ncbi:hypothetical protein KI387_015183, partial [Taxus chinensis]
MGRRYAKNRAAIWMRLQTNLKGPLFDEVEGEHDNLFLEEELRVIKESFDFHVGTLELVVGMRTATCERSVTKEQEEKNLIVEDREEREELNLISAHERREGLSLRSVIVNIEVEQEVSQDRAGYDSPLLPFGYTTHKNKHNVETNELESSISLSKQHVNWKMEAVEVERHLVNHQRRGNITTLVAFCFSCVFAFCWDVLHLQSSCCVISPINEEIQKANWLDMDYISLAKFDMDTFLFTSESVNEGHPDKLCDQISDAVLDACLEQDPDSKVACETCTKTNMVMVFGEITTKADVDYEQIVRNTCREIGFTSDDVGLDANKCKVLVNIEQQSPDIAQGVHGHLTKRPEDIGAGDQGHMFGYATDETPELMPLTHVLATKLGAKLTEVRRNGICPWMRPDGKTQVTIEYRNEGGAMVPERVHTVLISTQHDETVTNDQIAADLKEHVIKPVIPKRYLDENTIFHLNPSGRFVIGGPHGDAGLTGRKIIVDTYGGWGAHGGGAFSGKDPTKVDRSGAYLVSYAIGVPKPLSIFVDTYGTGRIHDKEILNIIKETFDFRPGVIAINLDLKRGGNGRFQKTAAYGHFGRDDPDFTWEIVKPLNVDK